MHVPRLPPTKVSSTSTLFSVAADLALPRSAYPATQTNAMHHEPCRLLGDANSARDFVRTDTVLAIRQHPDRGNHFSNGIGESSKTVPTFAENWRLECTLLHCHLRWFLRNTTSFRPQVGQTRHHPASEGGSCRPERCRDRRNTHRLLQGLWLLVFAVHVRQSTISIS